MLGDEALACLRDLKRWLKLYDERYDRYDVARCLAESNLVGGDLLQIMASWPEHAPEDKMKFKTALACLELLVPLTWPIKKDINQMTENHHRHIPYLLIAQLDYKRLIINFDGARILHTALRCIKPSYLKPMKERTARDDGIIKLLLYFIRNIAMIAPTTSIPYEHETEISRSALIDALNYQDILHFLLIVSCNIGEDFNTEDMIILDIIFHIIKGIDVEELFWDEQRENDNKILELKRLRMKEASMLSSYQRHAPTRHNRFGSMAWIHREDARTKTVVGQAAIGDSTKSLAKIDNTKRFRPPRRPFKGENGPLDFYTPVTLNLQAKKYLRKFVENFLDSCFNPLFEHIRKTIDREAERVLDYHPRQFFYLVSWFLQAERVRRSNDDKKKKVPNLDSAEDDFNRFSLIATVLSQEMFVTLNRTMTYTYESKMWPDLSACLKCFSQIILTVQDMKFSAREEDQEIAANILSRIFYEHITHDLIATVTRTYNDQGFGYLDSVTEIASNYLRVLEHYSKENTNLQVRSRRKSGKRNKAAAEAGSQGPDDTDEADDETENIIMAKKISLDRKLDFKRFSSRFAIQGCVNTFVTFASHYRELKPAQLKRAHRFFYRVAFKNEMSILLFRVDIIELLHRMIQGPEGLDSKSAEFREWEELVRQILKKCIRKIQEHPELIVEMLFSKTSNIAHFLEYGYDKQTSTSRPRAVAELQVRGGKKFDEQVAIVVSVMLDNNEESHLRWLKSEIIRAEVERRNWERSNKIIPSIETDLAVEEAGITPPEISKQVAPLIRIHYFPKL